MKQKVKLLSLTKLKSGKKKFNAEFQITKSNGKVSVKNIKFGAKGMSDYTIHKDKDRRDRYITRHKKDLRTGDPTRAGYLSMYVLWNKPSFKTSLADYKRRLNTYNRTGNFPLAIKGSPLTNSKSGNKFGKQSINYFGNKFGNKFGQNFDSLPTKLKQKILAEANYTTFINNLTSIFNELTELKKSQIRDKRKKLIQILVKYEVLENLFINTSARLPAVKQTNAVNLINKIERLLINTIEEEGLIGDDRLGEISDSRTVGKDMLTEIRNQFGKQSINYFEKQSINYFGQDFDTLPPDVRNIIFNKLTQLHLPYKRLGILSDNLYEFAYGSGNDPDDPVYEFRLEDYQTTEWLKMANDILTGNDLIDVKKKWNSIIANIIINNCEYTISRNHIYYDYENSAEQYSLSLYYLLLLLNKLNLQEVITSANYCENFDIYKLLHVLENKTKVLKIFYDYKEYDWELDHNLTYEWLLIADKMLLSSSDLTDSIKETIANFVTDYCEKTNDGTLEYEINTPIFYNKSLKLLINIINRTTNLQIKNKKDLCSERVLKFFDMIDPEEIDGPNQFGASKVPDNVVNKSLYKKIKNKIRRDVDKKGRRWGAYDSGRLVREYKAAGGKYTGSKKSKTSSKKPSNLDRWYREKWIDACAWPKRKSCGRTKASIKSKVTYCRPSKVIDSNTPKTVQELTKAQIKSRCKRKSKNPKKIIK